MQTATDSCALHARAMRRRSQRYGCKSTWPHADPTGTRHLILTCPADVLDLQVFVGGGAGVAKQTVGRQHATLGVILASGQTRRNVTHDPTRTCTRKDDSSYLLSTFEANAITKDIIYYI